MNIANPEDIPKMSEYGDISGALLQATKNFIDRWLSSNELVPIEFEESRDRICMESRCLSGAGRDHGRVMIDLYFRRSVKMGDEK